MKAMYILKEGLLLGIGMCIPLIIAVFLLGQLSSIDPFDYHTSRIINTIIDNYKCTELEKNSLGGLPAV